MRQSVAASPFTPAGAFPAVPAVGTFKSVQVANPAAGHDFTLTVPANTWYQLLYGAAVFTASATVANRQIGFTFKDASANVLWYGDFVASITASQVAGIEFGFGLPPLSDTTFVRQIHELPRIPLLGPGFTFSSGTGGIQAADQWSAINFALIQFGSNAFAAL